MPHIRFRGIPAPFVQAISTDLPALLSEAVGCPEDWFTFEYVPTTFYFGGDVVQGPAFVEVLWFARDEDCRDRVAAILTEAVTPAAGDEDACVVFMPLEKGDYYENGEIA